MRTCSTSAGNSSKDDEIRRKNGWNAGSKKEENIICTFSRSQGQSWFLAILHEPKLFFFIRMQFKKYTNHYLSQRVMTLVGIPSKYYYNYVKVLFITTFFNSEAFSSSTNQLVVKKLKENASVLLPHTASTLITG